MRVPDVLCNHPRILFVGINPGATSGRVGHHFAGPGNPFWALLHAAKLTPTTLKAIEDARLCELGYGLTNICERTTKTAAELTRAELEAGRKRLLDKIDRIEPRLVALVGWARPQARTAIGGTPVRRAQSERSQRVVPELRREASLVRGAPHSRDASQ
jgi:mismatch-specific thymine-DNA glycosylase